MTMQPKLADAAKVGTSSHYLRGGADQARAIFCWVKKYCAAVLPDVDVEAAHGGRQLTLIVVAALLLHLPHPHPLARKAILGKDLGYCWQNKCPNRD